MTPITPADRKAYIALNMVSPQDQAAILSGDFDQAHGMQVLARHRVEAVEECNQLALHFADMCDGTDDPSSVTAKHTAAAIAEHIRGLGEV